jgi:hypothetical protein
MIDVHYIWIGGSEISSPYLINYEKCLQLNPSFNFKIWRNEECLSLVEEYELIEAFAPLTFICKCNFLKYLILHKFGGIYTDFDIEWKVPFNEIINKYDFPNKDLILTYTLTPVMDDPFIISKPNILGSCILYCIRRTNLKYDGELYLETGINEISKLEPVGPFGLTEWLDNNNISHVSFPQKDLLDNNGTYGNHEQKGNWKSK